MTINKVDEDLIFEKFRGLVADLEQDDFTLRRFLKARSYDLIKTEEMLRKCVKWRTDNNLEDVLNWKIPDEIIKSFPIEYPGMDNKGRTIMYIALGTWPLRPMVEAGYGMEMRRYIRVCLERLVSEIEKTAQKQFVLILDLKGISLWTNAHLETTQVIGTTFREFEAYYPETLGEAFLINAPFIFHYVWPLIKKLLTGNTISKVILLGSNETKYISAFLERIPEASLPKKLREVAGRTKVC